MCVRPSPWVGSPPWPARAAVGRSPLSGDSGLLGARAFPRRLGGPASWPSSGRTGCSSETPGPSVGTVCGPGPAGGAWGGDGVAFALACQRRLRFRQDLVERLGRDRQRPQGHLIGSGFDQLGEVVLGPGRRVLHAPGDGSDSRRRSGAILQRCIGDERGRDRLSSGRARPATPCPVSSRTPGAA